MTPGPKSTRYGVPLTTMAVAGPERSGSGRGVPVPSMTICVVGVGASRGLFCFRLMRAKPRLQIGGLQRVLDLAFEPGADRLRNARGRQHHLIESDVEAGIAALRDRRDVRRKRRAP